jgi:hypothetical protein
VISPLSKLNFEKPTPFRHARKTLLPDARRYFEGCGRGATESVRKTAESAPIGKLVKNQAARPGFATNPPKARQSISRNDWDWRVSVKPVAEAGLHLVVLQAAVAV